jgi:hypothetical protein
VGQASTPAAGLQTRPMASFARRGGCGQGRPPSLVIKTKWRAGNSAAYEAAAGRVPAPLRLQPRLGQAVTQRCGSIPADGPAGSCCYRRGGAIRHSIRYDHSRENPPQRPDDPAHQAAIPGGHLRRRLWWKPHSSAARSSSLPNSSSTAPSSPLLTRSTLQPSAASSTPVWPNPTTDIKHGRVYGPFNTAEEMAASIEANIKKLRTVQRRDRSPRDETCLYSERPRHSEPAPASYTQGLL